MSVLIRGEKMPKSCGECQSTLGLFSSKCPLFKDFPKKFDYDSEIGNKGRYAGCPLVEIPPHGDLIDRNKLIKSLGHEWDVCMDDTEFTNKIVWKTIENEPTVIESEEDDEHTD